jgi:5'(3')-deoxyribonucleotidase
MLHVGFDVDGVLRKLRDRVIDVYKEEHPEYGQFFKKGISNSWSFKRSMKPFNGSVYEHFDEKMFNNPSKTVVRKVYREAEAYGEARNHFSKYYNILNAAECEVSICTHQPVYSRAEATVKWLRFHSIPYDNVIVTRNGDKSIFGLDFLLDDKPQNILDVSSSGGTGVLMLQPWNKTKTSNVKYTARSINDYVKIVINEHTDFQI